MMSFASIDMDRFSAPIDDTQTELMVWVVTIAVLLAVATIQELRSRSLRSRSRGEGFR